MSALEFENMAEFLARAAQGLVAVEVEAMDVVEHCAEKVADDMRSTAPVGSGVEDVPGELRDSISTDRQGLEVEIIVDVPYAAYVNYGTSKMPAQPFFTAALATAKF